MREAVFTIWPQIVHRRTVDDFRITLIQRSLFSRTELVVFALRRGLLKPD